MTKEELIYWLKKYNSEEDLYNKGEEKKLGEKFRQNNYIEKEDLINVLKWKFQGPLVGRQKMNIERVNKIDDLFIEEVSSLAFKTSNDQLKFKLLSCIDGVGLSVASVILSFYNPKNYGILDIHSWRGLFNEKEPKNIFASIKPSLKFLQELRSISKKYNMACREIEKAYFKEDKDKK
jgi:hypothetical protein